MVTTWNSLRDGLRRNDAWRVSQHTETCTGRCEPRRYDYRQKYGREEVWKEQDFLRVKRILCVIVQESRLRHANQRQGAGAPTETAHTSHTLVNEKVQQPRSQSTHGFVG